MEKYLADRLYALIYRMCQVHAFSSRLHAKGFPAIGKYEPKTPPRTAGVTKCVIGFGRCSGFVRHFCWERPTRTARRPVARAFLAPGLRKAEPDSRMLRSLSPATFPVLSPGARYISGRIQYPGNSSLFFSLVFRRVAGIAARRGFPFARIGNRALRTGRSLRSDVGSARNADSCPVGRPVPEPPPRRSPAEASYPVRIDTAIICFVMWQAYPPRSCDIAQPRLAAADRLSATRPPSTERNSCAKSGSIGNAKAGTSGHMIRDGDGLRAVPEISVRFPFSARRGRPLRAA